MFEERNIYEVISEAFHKVYNGTKRIEMEIEGFVVTAYVVGKILRIDVKPTT